MIPATSAKKRSLMPSGKLRQALRGHGHRLSAIVQIGKAGITPALVKQVEQALSDHELVKLKVAADSATDRFAVAEKLAERPGVNIVQIVGGAVLIYKRHPSTPRYEGRRAQAPATDQEDATADKPAKSGPKAKSPKPARPARRGRAPAIQRRPRR
jgi:RNA-binding protein